MSLVTINFFGDLNLGHNRIDDPFYNIKKDLLNADLNVCNLEGPIIKNYKKGYIRKSAPICTLEDNIQYLSNNNINCVCLANNHIMDYQQAGLKETILNLEKYCIKYFGAGDNLILSLKPASYIIDNIKVGLLGFSWDVIKSINARKNKAGTAPLNKKIILDNVKKNKYVFDFLIVHLHFNYEYEQYPLPSQRKLCHEIIDNGADIIIGHHPHILQGIENYKGKLIAYSLGNFFFSNIISAKGNLLREWPMESKNSIILRINLFKDLSYNYNIIPIYTDNDYNIKLYKSEEKKKLLEEIKYLSLPLYLDDKEYRKYFKNNRKRILPDWFTNIYYIQKFAVLLFKIYEKIKKH
ncbi:MAG: CapA family protein [Candidatus Helarchaeota archaeon]